MESSRVRGKRTAFPPLAAAAAAAAPRDHTAGLCNRSLAAILLRLPSPATLARAAGVCRRWRRVATSPAFLRLFRRLHPPPLLGFFVCNDGFTVERVNGVLVGQISSPTFFMSNPAPEGLSGAVSRCINFSLDSLPDVERWALADTCDGLLLLCDSFSGHDRLRIPSDFVVCDPITGRFVLFGDAPLYEIDHESSYLGAALLLTDGGGDRLCFEVLVVTYFMFGPRLLVFSSRSGAWTVHPSANVGGRFVMPMLGSVGYDMHANGCVYWVIDDEKYEASEYLMVLDTRTKAFSTIKLLSSMRTRYEGNMRVVRTDNGELRLVALADTVLDFWRLDRSRSTRGRTVILDAGDGFVFLKHFGSDWVFVLDVEAMVLMPLPHKKYYFGPALPYRMALQPPFPVLD
ncbi:hypothetical protein HU200_007909 [Digitaria exilis]|uniref:F-box domain-containing protein n=1 Tax=Digitaria exilis TaxID=1010633 RepID=A0A835FMF9_9POAL|nr:hypothetical protein HU200_007909 [Digitaria exilis]